jgi:cell division protein FtsW
MKHLLMRMDKILYFTVIVLSIFGLLMIFSASSILSVVRYGASPYLYFFKQGAFLLIGFLAFTITVKIPLKKYDNIIWLLIIGIVLSLFFLLTYGSLTNNAVSWFDLGPVSIQPSEFAKLVTILYLAIYFEKNKSKLDNIFVVITPLVICAVIIGLIIIQPDLGTTIIYGFIVFLIFLSLPVEKQIKSNIYKMAIGGVVIALLVLTAFGKSIFYSHQLERFNFLKPCQRFETTGYHVCNGYIAINHGGIFGVGLGNSTQKYSYLPEAHTDFIYAIVVEELGLIGGLAILIGYTVILTRIIKIAKKSPTIKGAVICYGAFIYLIMHILVNLMGVLGLMPLTGVPLPFFSYGGSFIISILITLALVQRVQIENFNYYNKKDLA